MCDVWSIFRFIRCIYFPLSTYKFTINNIPPPPCPQHTFMNTHLSPPTPPIKLHIQLSKAAKVSGGVGIMCVGCVWWGLCCVCGTSGVYGVWCLVCGVWCVVCGVCGTCDDMICNLWNTVIKCGFFFLQWPISVSLWCFYASPFFFSFVTLHSFKSIIVPWPIYLSISGCYIYFFKEWSSVYFNSVYNSVQLCIVSVSALVLLSQLLEVYQKHNAQ